MTPVNDYQFYVIAKDGHAPIVTREKSGAYEAWDSLGRSDVSIVLHHIWKHGHYEDGKWITDENWHESTCVVRQPKRRINGNKQISYPFVFNAWEDSIVDKPSVAYEELDP